VTRYTRVTLGSLALSLSLSLRSFFPLSLSLTLSRSHLQALQPHWPRVLRACQQVEKNVSSYKSMSTTSKACQQLVMVVCFITT
jgi:hypothetical protein